MDSTKKTSVICRFCGLPIDRNNPNPKREWVMPSQNWFYHRDCYEDFVGIKKKMSDINDNGTYPDDYWLQLTYDYLQKDLKMHIEDRGYDQWFRFLKKGYTAKGIYFCLRWFYDVQRGDRTKSCGGIGIIPYIYKDGCSYWAIKRAEDEERRKKIEEQMNHKQEKEVVAIPRKKRQRKSINWDSVFQEENT